MREAAVKYLPPKSKPAVTNQGHLAVYSGGSQAKASVGENLFAESSKETPVIVV